MGIHIYINAFEDFIALPDNFEVFGGDDILCVHEPAYSMKNLSWG
jgi:hypothetical protein